MRTRHRTTLQRRSLGAAHVGLLCCRSLHTRLACLGWQIAQVLVLLGALQALRLGSAWGRLLVWARLAVVRLLYVRRAAQSYGSWSQKELGCDQSCPSMSIRLARNDSARPTLAALERREGRGAVAKVRRPASGLAGTVAAGARVKEACMLIVSEL